MYYVYIVSCSDKSLYTGITTDIKRRLEEHNGQISGAKYTRARQPVALVYSRIFDDRSLASKEEARIKKLSRLAKMTLITQM